MAGMPAKFVGAITIGNTVTSFIVHMIIQGEMTSK